MNLIGPVNTLASLHTHCRRRGRPLFDPKSMKLGYGPVCAAKEAAEDKFHHDVDDMIVTDFDGLLCERDPETQNAKTNIPRLKTKHSPTGLEWGYHGSGPADLVLNTLLHHGADPLIVEFYYQDFKDQFIATIPREGGSVTGCVIRAYIENTEARVSASDRFRPEMVLRG